MSWYTENFCIGRGLKSNVERRKFRFGLKSNVDFLIQLDLANLKTCLLDKTHETPFPPPTSTSALSDGSFLNLMQKMNLTRSQEFCKFSTVWNPIWSLRNPYPTILQTMTCWNLLLSPDKTLCPHNTQTDHVFVSKPRGIVMTKNALLITHVANVLVTNKVDSELFWPEKG